MYLYFHCHLINFYLLRFLQANMVVHFIVPHGTNIA